jgi:hypothetical protein
MTDDEWQAHITREAAKEIGRWLEAKGAGRLKSPIASLTMADLEAMAANAISRFIVLASKRIAERPQESAGLTRLLLG